MKEIRGIIDRFEGEFAVVEQEDRVMINIPRRDIPKEAKEGDCLVQIDGKFQVDPSETSKRRGNISRLSRELWE